MKFINAPKAPKAVGPYSHAAVLSNLVFCSGQIPLDPETMTLVENDIEVQTRKVFENIAAVLGEAGLSFENILKTTVFLKNMDDFPKMNAVYESILGDHKPARSTIEVAKLPMDALVEIECIACRE